MSRYSMLGWVVLLALFTGCSGKDTPPAAESADQAVMQVTQGLADGHPEVVWHALPASYQQDVTSLIHDFAAKMDAELWNRTFGVVQKATLVLDEKREFILDHPMLAAQIKDRDEAEEAWDAVVGILEVMAESELSDLDRLKKLDVEKFLAGTGGDLAKQFKKMEALAPAQTTGSMFGLADAEATVISSEGDRARLSVKAPGQPATEEDYVRVEGKWIPAQMADEWDKTIAEARAQLNNFSGEEMQKNKAMALMQLTMVEGALDQLLATETAEQFHTAVSGVMGMAMGAMMARAQSSSDVVMSDQPGNLFTTPQPQPSPSPSPSLPILNAAPPARYAEISTQKQKAAPAPQGSIESYLGKEVRVTERSGTKIDGFLVDVTDDLLFLEKRLGNDSSMTIEVRRSRVGSIEEIR